VLDLRPGITGLASLAYIDEEKLLANEPDKEAFYLKTLMPQKLELDLFYGENVSFLTDTQMIFATLAKLVHPAEKLHAYLQFRLLPSRSMGAPALPEKRPY